MFTFYRVHWTILATIQEVLVWPSEMRGKKTKAAPRCPNSGMSRNVGFQKLGQVGGFKLYIFSPLKLGMIPYLTHIFHMG